MPTPSVHTSPSRTSGDPSVEPVDGIRSSHGSNRRRTGTIPVPTYTVLASEPLVAPSIRVSVFTHVTVSHDMPTTRIQPKINRTVVPRRVIELGVLDPGELVFWAYSEADGAAAVSKHRRPFLENEWFKPVSYSRLEENRSITVPREFFPDYGGPATSAPLFERGEPVEFVLDDELTEKAVCLVRPA